VLSTAVVVTAVLAVLALAVPARLAQADWPRRSPAAALLLWQAVGITAGLLAVQAVVTVALAPAGPTHAGAVQAVVDGQAATRWWSVAAAFAAVVLVVRLVSVFSVSAVRTLRARHRNRVLVDLVATRNPLLPGTRVVDHDVPLAYCLPGLRPRVVLSRGVLDLLREDEVRAVLAHEDAHVVQRHDLVVLPFAAFGATFPRLWPVRTASEQVALLVEMLADDRAARLHPPEVLARALYKVGTAAVPSGGLGATTDGVLLRAQRLVCPPPALTWAELAAVATGTAVVLALPALGLLLPLAL
jgi:Zn-dependent protease with chaperone function